MSALSKTIRASGTLAIAAVLALAVAGGAGAQMRVTGISGLTSFTFTAGAGEVSIPDGGSVHFWGYRDLAGTEGVNLPQYPGPTLILNQGDAVTITLTSNLPYGHCTSIVFPGHAVTATGGSTGLLTQEACPGDLAPVQYTFTATEPGTYMYHSGTQPELQIEMGLLGAIIVRPSRGEDHAYNDASTFFDHENLFLLTSMDPTIHTLAEQNRFDAIDLTARWPVYWFINGRAAPDDLMAPFVNWLPHQPYNTGPRMTPGQKVLVRIIGGDVDQHPLHLHGNLYREVARYGRLLTLADGTTPAARKRFTTLTVPGQTVDAIFEWTGAKLGFDVYGPVNAACIDADDNMKDDLTGATCHDNRCAANDLVNNETGAPGADGFDDTNYEYCADHGKALPVTLPQNQNLAFGAWWPGSPFMGDVQPLPPGEGGLNPNGGYFFMWHSHTERELTNFDIFPGGMLSMIVVEPPGTPIP